MLLSVRFFHQSAPPPPPLRSDTNLFSVILARNSVALCRCIHSKLCLFIADKSAALISSIIGLAPISTAYNSKIILKGCVEFLRALIYQMWFLNKRFLLLLRAPFIVLSHWWLKQSNFFQCQPRRFFLSGKWNFLAVNRKKIQTDSYRQNCHRPKL